MSLLPSFQLELKAGPQFSNRPAATSTINIYTRQVRYFCRWLSPDGKAEHCTTTAKDVTRTAIIAYFADRRDQWSQNSILTAHIALSAFFRFLVSWGELTESPMAAVKTPRPEVKPVPIPTEEDVRRLLLTCERKKDFKSVRDYAILRTFLASGMRMSELVNLKLEDLHLTEGTIDVVHGKRGKARKVAIGSQVARALNQYLYARARHKDNRLEYLWIGNLGKLTEDGVWWIIHQRAEQASIQGVHAHTFRHWFAHTFQAAGGQLLSLMQLGGWTDMAMLQQRYGASLAEKRAVDEHHQKGIGEHI